jgi:hypothetical protein
MREKSGQLWIGELQLPREIGFDNHWKALKITPYPIHANLIVQFDVLGCVGVELAQNLSVLLDNNIN